MVRNKYNKFEEGPMTTLKTNEKNISICIPPDKGFPETGWKKDGWELIPLVPVKVRVLHDIPESHYDISFSARERAVG